ncbi:MAG: FecR domain-containing protein [Lachnospiraceae bacterium]|nr:FecR domain-containing protein [Lachnospiraceae bacterium]
MLKAFLGTLKGKIIAAAAGFVVTGGIVAGVAIAAQNAGYRNISVEEVAGTVTATGEKKNGQLLVGEHLVSGDFVSVEAQSSLTVCADKTKHLYADPETRFKLIDTSGKKGSTIKIQMEAGSTLHELTEKLGAGDVYEVETPNSTMSVRGTTFRVTVYRTAANVYYTLTEVTNGSVVVKLKDDSGQYTGEEATIQPGESALMREEGNRSEFVRSRTGDDSLILDYNNLPEDSVDRLIELITEPKELVRPHEHVEGEWVVDTEPTCTATGIRVKRCTICDEVLLIETLDKVDHEAGDWEFNPEPTCTEPGAREKKCKYCGLVMETEELEALGHTESDWIVTTEPTCTTRGAREKRCTVCDEVLETETLRALGHRYGNWTVTKEANCTEAGSRRHVCERCGAAATETVAALGHDYGGWIVTSDPNCTASGSEYRTCSRCGANDTQTIPARGHDWRIVESVSPCVENGVEIMECRVCGEPNERILPSLGYHVWDGGTIVTHHNPADPGGPTDPDLPDEYYMATCAACGSEYMCASATDGTDINQ